MEWVMLLLAGASEITWALSMKMSDGFSKVVPTVVTIVFYIASAILLSIALKKLPLGTAYAMWTGMGIIGTTLCGVALFNEVLTMPQIICVVMIVTGIAGLKLLGA